MSLRGHKKVCYSEISDCLRDESWCFYWGKTEFISCAEKTCSKWYHSKSQHAAAAAVQWSTPKWWKCFQNRWQSTISEARISKIITTVNICHTTTPDFWNILYLEIQIIKFPSPHIVRECELDELEENFSGVGVEWKK